MWPFNREKRASMRPPHCAGEIVSKLAKQYRDRLASMRPPHCAGEIIAYQAALAVEVLASMRPPHCAGEIQQDLEDAARQGLLQ